MLAHEQPTLSLQYNRVTCPGIKYNETSLNWLVLFNSKGPPNSLNADISNSQTRSIFCQKFQPLDRMLLIGEVGLLAGEQELLFGKIDLLLEVRTRAFCSS